MKIRVKFYAARRSALEIKRVVRFLPWDALETLLLHVTSWRRLVCALPFFTAYFLFVLLVSFANRACIPLLSALHQITAAHNSFPSDSVLQKFFIAIQFGFICQPHKLLNIFCKISGSVNTRLHSAWQSFFSPFIYIHIFDIHDFHLI